MKRICSIADESSLYFWISQLKKAMMMGSLKSESASASEELFLGEKRSDLTITRIVCLFQK